MKSDEYWRKREEAARKDRITDEKEMQKQIDAINQRMIDECNLQIDAWLQRYADKDGISLAEAKKRVSKLDIAEYERYAKKLVARGAVMRQEGKKVSYGSFTDEENEQMRLYNLTMKVNRLEMLKSRLGLETTAGYAELRNYLGDKLTDAAMAEAERQAGILGESVNMNAKEAGSIVNASFRGATFSQRLWKDQQELKAALDRSLTVALIQGQSSAKAAQQIREHFSGDFKKAGKAAMRLATTELARVEIGAQQKSFEKMGFKQYTFLAVGPHPCEICQALDGKHFDVDKMVPGENAPPMHPWCHCSVSAYSDRMDYDEWLNSGAAKKGVALEEFKPSIKKMAASSNGNDWSETVPQEISKEDKKKIIVYAKERNINIVDLSQFDGDIELLKSCIDTAANLYHEFPLNKKLTLTVKNIDDDDFGRTDNRTIVINTKALRNRRITEKNISTGEFASKKLEDIVAHEFGHYCGPKIGKPIEMLRKAYYNVYKKNITEEEFAAFIDSEISQYAKSKNYSELLAELFAKHNSNPTDITEEFFRLMKEGL